MNNKKRDSIKKGLGLWHWLSKHPKATKFDYFSKKRISEIPFDECYACEFTIKNNTRNCQDCYLMGLWDYDKSIHYNTFPCFNIDSPFYKWNYYKTVRKKYALIIADYHKKLLRREYERKSNKNRGRRCAQGNNTSR